MLRVQNQPSQPLINSFWIIRKNNWCGFVVWRWVELRNIKQFKILINSTYLTGLHHKQRAPNGVLALMVWHSLSKSGDELSSALNIWGTHFQTRSFKALIRRHLHFTRSVISASLRLLFIYFGNCGGYQTARRWIVPIHFLEAKQNPPFLVRLIWYVSRAPSRDSVVNHPITIFVHCSLKKHTETQHLIFLEIFTWWFSVAR